MNLIKQIIAAIVVHAILVAVFGELAVSIAVGVTLAYIGIKFATAMSAHTQNENNYKAELAVVKGMRPTVVQTGRKEYRIS